MKIILIVAAFFCGSLSLAQDLGKATVFGKATIRLVGSQNSIQTYQVSVSGFALIGLPKLGFDTEIFEELESASFRGKWLPRASSSIGQLEFVTLYGTYQTRLKIQQRVHPRASSLVRSSACAGSAGDGVVTGLVGLSVKDPIAQFRRLGFRSPLLRQVASGVLGGCAGYEINFFDLSDGRRLLGQSFANNDGLLGVYLQERQSIILTSGTKETSATTLSHELFHAIAATYISLPNWLNEGLAVLTQESLFAAQLRRSDQYLPRQIEQSLITVNNDAASQFFYFPLADYQNQDFLLYLLNQKQLPNAGTMQAIKNLLEANVNSIPRLREYLAEFGISLTQTFWQYTELVIREAAKLGRLNSVSTPLNDTSQSISFSKGQNYSARIMKIEQPRKVEFRDVVVRAFDSEMNYLATLQSGQMVQPGYVLVMVESARNDVVVTIK